jgi:hypothetical protein
VKEPAGGKTGALAQGYYVCPVRAGRFGVTQIMLVLLGIAALYGFVAVVRRKNDPNAFVRDTRLDPPAA